MFSKIIVALALLAGASAFAPMASRPMRAAVLNADLAETLATCQGPHICWGSEGGLEDPPIGENEIKGYDNFGKFKEQMDKAGIDLSGGKYTIFAPVDSLIKGDMAPEVVKYHIAEGEIPFGSISGSMKTLNGESLSYKRFARQTFVDDAIVGQQPNYGGGPTYPVDIKADNGVIHAIQLILEPGWSQTGAEAGLGGIN